MIVKNESHIIRKTLENVVEKMDIDYWVISDTGSTDNTKEIITEFFKEKNIPGELHDDEWKDFGHNRSKVLEYAFSCPSRFLFMHDADDLVVGDINLPQLEKVISDKHPTQISLRIGEGFTYNRPLIYDNNYKWCFKGVLHEFVSILNESEGPIYTYIHEVPGYHIDSRREGARSQDPDKYYKDALILEKAYEEEVKNNGPLQARYAFYCAQSYKDCNRLEESIKYYLIRTTLGHYQEEVYLSYMYAARSMITLNKPEDEIEHTFLKGWESMRDRSECLYYLAFYLRSKDKFTKAYLYSSLGCKIPFPRNRFLFLEKDIFDYKIFDECAISAFYTGRYEECYKLNAKLMQKVYNDRIIKNMEFCLPALMEKATMKAGYNFMKPKKRIYGVTLTMTTCKRYDLFEKTVNSIINNVKDLYMIERFICIDDNSTKEDRKKMLENYPFFEFKFKRNDQKGHVQSMNMLKSLLTDEDKFIMHIEDDFPFIIRKNYIGKSIRVIRDNEQVSQVLFNRNYAETVSQYSIKGGIPFGRNKFLIHEYISEPEKRGDKGCSYWPGFSFRPSIIRKDMLDKIGFFNAVPHFEMEYSNRVQKAGYISVFMNGVYGVHIGKLTNESDKPNAYSLNNVKQF